MAATISLTAVKNAFDALSTHRAVFADYTGPASYPAAGDPLVPGDFKNLGIIDAIFGVAIKSDNSAVRILVYNPTTQVMHWYIPNTGLEVAGAQDLSAYTARVMVLGV